MSNKANERRRVENCGQDPLFKESSKAIYDADIAAYRKNGITVKVIQENVRRTYFETDEALREMKGQWPDQKGPVCRPGCHLCCSIYVDVSLPEIIHLVSVIKRLPNVEEIKARVAQAAKDIAGLDLDQRARKRIYCPLLTNCMCEVYDNRPFSCRAWNSGDYQACETASNNVPIEGVQWCLYSGAGAGTQRAFISAVQQRDWQLVEMIYALDVGLNGKGNAVADLLLQGINRFGEPK